MQTALSSLHPSTSGSPRTSADRRRSLAAGGGDPSGPRRRTVDRRGAAIRRRFLAGCVAFFVLMLAIAAISMLTSRDASGAPTAMVPLVATYLASTAWLAAVIVLLRGAREHAVTAWAGGGAALLVASFVIQVAVARGA